MFATTGAAGEERRGEGRLGVLTSVGVRFAQVGVMPIMVLVGVGQSAVIVVIVSRQMVTTTTIDGDVYINLAAAWPEIMGSRRNHVDHSMPRGTFGPKVFCP